MKRKYANEFHYAGLSRLSHCTGPNWEEIWTDPQWVTKPLTVKRAKFLWTAIQRVIPELEPLYSRPKFKAGKKYVLCITETEGEYLLSPYRNGGL